VSADAGILVQAAYADGTGSVAASKSVTIKNTATIQTYTLTVNYDHALGSVSSSAVNSSIAAGTTVQLYAGTTSQSHFVDWGGDASGPSQAISVMMNGNKTVNANFASGNTDFGTLKVNILPAEAAAAGVTWGFSPTDFRVSGSTYSTWPASYWIALHTVDGWLGPNQQLMTITKGGSSTVSVTFTKDTTPGTLSVALTPPSAVAAGAKFTVNGATYGDGANVSLLPGTYNVTFAAATGSAEPNGHREPLPDHGGDRSLHPAARPAVHLLGEPAGGGPRGRDRLEDLWSQLPAVGDSHCRRSDSKECDRSELV
jgi:hypothetical protein